MALDLTNLIKFSSLSGILLSSSLCAFSGDGSTTANYIGGPFDAWDTFRDDSTPPSDRNISTKIANKPFTLSFASLNKANNAYEAKNKSNNHSDAKINVSIYPSDSTEPISNILVIHNYPYYGFKHESNNLPGSLMLRGLTVEKAERDATVGFKFCAEYKNKEYTLHPLGDCTNTIVECDDETDGTATMHLCRAGDHFAIRPDKFEITAPTSTVYAGEDFNITFFAKDEREFMPPFNRDNTLDYNESYNSTFTVIAEETKPSCKTGILHVNDFDFSDGNATDINTTYSEVGEANITIKEKESCTDKFASIDCDDTNADDLTIEQATATVTIIPHHFDISTMMHNNGNNFTYIAKDLEKMAARLDINATAKNKQGITTENYNELCYSQDTNYTLSYDALTISPVNSLKILFYKETNSSVDGNATINDNINFDVNNTLFKTDNNGTASLYLKMNFDRNASLEVNPFKFTIKDINVTDANNIKGTKEANQDATFYYGRAHASHQRFSVKDDSELENANLYYEVYCYQDHCDQSLLPSTLKHTNDVRWYQNSNHNTSIDGKIFSVTEKNRSLVIGRDLDITTNPNKISLDYNETQFGYPYETTMEINASDWLIYNPNNGINEFQAEFINETLHWSGTHETNTSTTKVGNTPTHRRVMW